MKIEAEAKGVTQTVANLEGLGFRARDLSAIKTPFAEIVGRANRRRFDAHGDGSWPPLSDVTAARKAKGGRADMLIDTGKLRDSLEHQRARVTELSELTSSGTGNVPYDRYLNYGTKYMPARKLVELRPSEERQVANLVSQHITKGRNPL